MTAHDAYLELCAGYALGCLDEGDRRRLEEHLADGCAECEAALADHAPAVVVLAATALPATPPPAVRERVLRVVGAEAEVVRQRAGSARGGRGWASLAWAWGTAAVLAAFGVFSWFTAERLGRELTERRAQIAQLEQRLAEESQWAAVLTSPRARVALFAPLAPEGDVLRGRAIYDPATRRAVIVFETFTAPSGKDYELWAIRDGRPASLGVIRPAAAGRVEIRIPDAGDADTLGAFAVSLEASGGSPDPNAPSGPVVAVGALGG